MSHIEVRDLTLGFPGRPPVMALDGVDLTVEEGTVVAVLGPSGCGKTTLLRAVAGLARPDGGTISVGGAVLDGSGVHRRPERRAVGLVPQEGALFPHLDVAGNIAFGLSSWRREQRQDRVDELLELTGLAGMGSRHPHELSGGQQQRVALARALAPRPAVVLLDEPFSALDTALRAALRDDVMGTLRAAGTTAVLVTHDQVEAMTVADEVAVMRAGRIVQAGPPAEVYHQPVDLWTARFLGEAVVLPTRTAEGGLACALGPVDVVADADADAAGGRERVAFLRPEQVRRAAPGSGGITATVTAVRFQGADALVQLQVGEQTITARWPSWQVPTVGDVVELVVEGSLRALPT